MVTRCIIRPDNYPSKFALNDALWGTSYKSLTKLVQLDKASLTYKISHYYSMILTSYFNLSSHIFIKVFAEQGNVPNIIIAVSKSLVFNIIYLYFSKMNFVVGGRWKSFLASIIQNWQIISFFWKKKMRSVNCLKFKGLFLLTCLLAPILTRYFYLQSIY